MALVPLTVVTHRLAPMAFAQAFSNSSTTPALDHTPLLSTSSTRGSSVAGTHMGHLGHLGLGPELTTGAPPNIAGVLVSFSLLLVKKADTVLAPSMVPAPVSRFCFINFRLEFLFAFFMNDGFCYLLLKPE
jgi:hypothetical protein